MRTLVQKLSAVQEAVIVTAIFAGLFIYSAMLVVFSGFPVAALGDGEAMSLVLFEGVAFCLAAVVLRWRGWQRSDFTFTIGWRNGFIALLLLAVSYFADVVLYQFVGPALDEGSLLGEISASTRLSFGMAALLSVVNGTFEEFFLCRYLIVRFQDSGAAFAITLSACIRMSYHVYQGPFGTLSILAFGLIIGIYYWQTRDLGTVVAAHIAADLVALT